MLRFNINYKGRDNQDYEDYLDKQDGGHTSLYYDKYMKYKMKYLELRLINEGQIYENEITQNEMERLKLNPYDCDPSKKFSEICFESPTGKYHTKESCYNDCETKYIFYNLVKSNLKIETQKYVLFIKELMNEGIKMYIKGGNALGLKILKMVYEKYPGDNFETYLNDFVKLQLIKDWDFVGYTDDEISDEYRAKLDQLAAKYKLVPRAKTFILYQTKNPLQLDGKALIELAILGGYKFSEMEMPATTMKIKINQYNSKYIFMLANSFYTYKLKQTAFDIDVIKRMINHIDISILPYKNGLFVITEQIFDRGSLADQLIEFIRKFVGGDLNLAQFLVVHIEEPHRIFLRLLEKNIPKIDKITKFLLDNDITKTVPDWLLDTKFIKQTIDKFIESLGKKIYDIYTEKYNELEEMSKKLDDQQKQDKAIITGSALAAVDEFLDGVMLKRIEIEYNNFGPEGRKLIKTWFVRLFIKIDIAILQKLVGTSEIAKILVFLNGKHLFD